ncbi:T9SS type A sorting domain-containing protein [Chryseobacterium luquanense]|uniref:T9SS type A sorting domain-containing protein n=1 Tax=Chryseobacterium luquanense TaxID=2983766 RepID=A0ABT3Y5S0_9FLAO|nr:T9SS type A sorting domain-containing protein [Chryseobacterium luquanense]MCX8533503.1 T9SS type A sorting domain-containing protein [Chryseobacterium luquanense]
MFKNLYIPMVKIGLGTMVLSIATSNFVNAQQWQNVGSSANVSAGGSSFNNLVVDNAGNYYLSYYDVSVQKGSVQKFNGTLWSYVGGSAGITTSYATYNSLSINSNGTNLYYTNQGKGLEVRQFNGSSWTQLASPTTSTINYHASAVAPSGVLFTYSNLASGTVKRLVNGTWEQVGNTGFSDGASFAEMVIGTNNKVYTANVASGIRVYENTTTATTSNAWTLVGGAIVDAASSGEQYTSDIAIDANNNLYVAYVSNSANSKKVNVKKFNGTTWEQMGNAYFSAGGVQHVAIAVTSSGKPYVVASRWENDNFLKNTAYQLDTVTNTWSTFGGDFISDGEATYNDLAVDNTNNYLVLAYSQDFTKVKRISLAPSTTPVCNNTDPGNNAGDTGCVTFNYRGQPVTYATVRGTDGKIWLQQNLGSTKVATSLTDSDAYGDLFQWGRWDDGHQLRNSALLGTAPSPNNPAGLNGGNTTFYSAAYNSSSNFWSGGITADTWSAASSSSVTATSGADPCKAIGSDWRLPTVTEVDAAVTAENITEFNSALSSNLKLIPAGMKDYSGIFSPGTRLYLWSSSSSPYTGSGQHLYVSQYSALSNSAGRDAGMSVRCIKSVTTGLGTTDIRKVTVGVYPNPTNGILNIKTDSPIENVNITNVVGQRLKVQYSNHQVNLQRLPNGVYIVELIMKNGLKISKKVIKN